MRRTTRRFPTLLAALVALCALTACGGDGEEVAEPIDSRDGTATTGDEPAGEGEGDQGEGAGEGDQGEGAGEGEGDQRDGEPGEGDDEGDDEQDGDGGDGDEGGRGDALTITSSQDHDCAGEDVAVRGTDLRVGLTGTCGQVTVGGNGNVVTIAEATSVAVEGAGQDVDITGSTDAITLAGAGHQVAHTGDPAIDDSSAGSTVG